MVKKPSAPSRPAAAGARVTVAFRWIRGVVLVLGFVTALLGLTATFGFATDNLTVRVLVALVLLVGLPLFLADKLLARLKAPSDRVGVALDVFGVLWVALAWLFVAAVPRVLINEGDRQTRAGTLWLARTAYALGGVTPTFRTERTLAPPASAAPAADGGAPAPAPKESH